MIGLEPAALSARDCYKLLIGSVIPRPIAFVSTLSAEGVLNAAPYSFFNIVSSNPPMLSISVQRRNGQPKDTARNAIEKGELVVHISDESYIEKINATAANLPPEESEVLLAGLTPAASVKISVPGIAEAKIRMECVLEQSIPLGGTPAKPGPSETALPDPAPACDLLIARIVYFHLHESVYDGAGHIDPAALQAVSRLAGSSYAKLGELFALERPQ